MRYYVLLLPQWDVVAVIDCCLAHNKTIKLLQLYSTFKCVIFKSVWSNKRDSDSNVEELKGTLRPSIVQGCKKN